MSFSHLTGEIPHIGRAGGIRGRSECWNPLMRRLGWASLLVWFRLLNHGLLQLLLHILLSTSLSSSSPFVATTQAPSTALLLRRFSVLLLLVLELRGFSCLFHHAELVCLLLSEMGHTCTSMGLPRCSRCQGDLIQIKTIISS